MARAKRIEPKPIDLPPDGEVRERHTIQTAYYWINEGYGGGQRFETLEAAMADAKRCAPDAESTGKAVMHVIETHVRTTVVRSDAK